MTSQKGLLSTSSKPLLPEILSSWILLVTFPTAFVLGTLGYIQYSSGEESLTISNAMYHSAQLFLMNTSYFELPVPWMLEVARWMAATSTGLVLFNGAMHIFNHERLGYKLRHRKNHIIVCGLGRRGITVVESLSKSKIKIVAIDKNPEQEIVERLHNMGIPLIIGDASRGEILKEARIELALKIYTLCTDDTTNLSIALSARNINKNTNSNCQYFIHINDAEVRNALQTNYQGNLPEPGGKFYFTDAYGPEAIRLLAHGFPLDHNGIAPDDPRQVHLIIMGFGCMGRTIAVKAAQLGQFANRKRMRISVIDHNAAVNQSALLFHHPFISDVADFSFYRQEVLSPETRSLVEKWCNEPAMVVNLAICFDNPSIAYDTVFNLLPVFKRNNLRVVVRVNEINSFEYLMKGAGVSMENGFHIQPFGIEKEFENLIHPENDEAEKFAIDIHTAYAGVIREELMNDQFELGKKEKSGELNPWETLKEDFRESNRQQAVHMYFKIRACGFEIADETDPRPGIIEFEPGLFHALSVMEHDRWVAERKVNNWKFGKPSDKPNRINENLVEWDQLTETVKGYDRKTVAMIPELLGRVGKKMVAGK